MGQAFSEVGPHRLEAGETKDTATQATEASCLVRIHTMPKSVIFVDRRVAEYQYLINSFVEPAEVFVLDGLLAETGDSFSGQ